MQLTRKPKLRNSMIYVGSKQSGYTLIEVLIAIVVFTIGLVGIAAMMGLSIKSTHVANMRTQAVFLGQSLQEIMRSNGAAVWAGTFNGTYPKTAATNCANSNCSPAAMATWEAANWSTQMQQLLPASQATVGCDAFVGTAPGLRADPNMLCTLRLTWEETVDAGASGTRNQTFLWAFNP